MSLDAKDLTPAQICDRVEKMMMKAAEFFPPSTNLRGGKWEEYAQEAGVNLELAALSEHSLDYSFEKRHAFSLGYSFRFNMDYWRDDIAVRCEVTWASGGGDPATAVAQASLHLEAAQKCAQCQMAAWDELRSIKVRDDEDRECFRAGVKLFYAKVAEAQAAVNAVHRKHNPKDED